MQLPVGVSEVMFSYSLSIVFLSGVVMPYLHLAESSKILAMMTVPSHSHHLWQRVYLEALAKKGHEITYLGVDEYKNPPHNIRHIFLSNAYDLYGVMNFTDLAEHDPYGSVIELEVWEDIAAESMVKTKGFQEFLKIIKSETFDLVLFDLSTTYFLLGAVDVLGRPPVMGLTPFSIPPHTFPMSGTPYPIQNNPHTLHKYGKDMTFWQRLDNAALFLYTAFTRPHFMNNQDKISKEVFGNRIRHVTEITDDININIVNANWATDFPFPTAPGLIPIAGAHINEPKPLPADLKQFLDSSPDGVIYFSLGSNIQSTFLESWQIKELTTAFAQLAPLKILWKWEKDELPGKPENVRIGKWLPQNDVLAHPNVRLFFTHGGMLGTQEALYHGIPVVGMPIFLDQHVNINKAVTKGIGERLNLAKLKATDVVAAIKKVIKTPSYSNKAKEYSKIFRDQQNPPLETVIYWTEYAIRHKGAPHLRPASKNLHWFQGGLYDLLLTAFVAISVILLLLYKMLTKFIRTLFGVRNKTKAD